LGAVSSQHPRDILARMSRVSGVSAMMSRGCYEETAAVEFKRITCNTLQFLCNNCTAFQRDGKPAIITQKLQRVAFNKLHMKPCLKAPFTPYILKECSHHYSLSYLIF